MTERASSHEEFRADAMRALLLLAIDPIGLGGAILRASAGPHRDAWVECFKKALPLNTSFSRVPPHVGRDRLTGALDVAATLLAGKPVMDQGILRTSRGEVLILASAERMVTENAALIANAMDDAQGFSVLAFDEGLDADERAPALLTERVAFVLNLDLGAPFDTNDIPDLSYARALNPNVEISDAQLTALADLATALGVMSVRPLLFATRVAKASAALLSRQAVDDNDLSIAARLVLAPRATRFPEAVEEQPQENDASPPENSGEGEEDMADADQLADQLIEAIKASLPEGLIDALDHALLARRAGKSGVKSRSEQAGKNRGRPIGARRGDPRHGARLHLVETLRAAAPWQRVRRLASPKRDGLHVTRDDLRVWRFKEKRETTAIFVVDASGSAALHRMAEAKGAIEMLLADCYVRRDQVALIAFRGMTADILLPPTRSLQRAKRALSDLPGGGGTPLSQGIEAALRVADQVKRSGGVPLVVFLTDGRANIARDGTADRVKAREDSLQAAKSLRAAGLSAMLIDLSDQRQGAAHELSSAMAAQYLPLPHADASRISRVVDHAMKHEGARA